MTEAKINEQVGKDLVEGSEAKNIIMSGVKELNFDGNKIYVRFPTLKEKNVLDKEYSSTYVKMIRESNLPTSREWAKELEKRGLWSKTDEDAFEECRKMYMETYKEWYSVPYEDRDSEDFKQLDLTYAQATLNYMKMYADKESLFSHTIEKSLENEQIIKQVILCCYKDNEMKTLSFKNREELESYPNGEAVIGLIRDCATFWMGVSERFLEQLPVNISGKENTK